MERIEYPHFDERKALYDWLVKNKHTLLAQKKSIFKKADAVPFCTSTSLGKVGHTQKANTPIDPGKLDEIKVKAVINTTNLMDSHLDVHVPGLWKKSLQENKWMLHLQEHNMAFDHIISEDEDLKAYTETYTWKELGYSQFKGDTEALVFDSVVKKERNDFMFTQYAKARVKNHSVGMQYVKIVLAINNEDYGAEFEAWEKYFPIVANKDFAEDTGFFWAVKEAKAIEGSAVVRGSNWATPTLENNMKDIEPGDHSTKEDEEPLVSTPKVIDYSYLKTKILTL